MGAESVIAATRCEVFAKVLLVEADILPLCSQTI